MQILPCLLQDTRGFGWPCAIHSITAGPPSTTVAFWGGATIATRLRASVAPAATKRGIVFIQISKNSSGISRLLTLFTLSINTLYQYHCD